MKKFKRSIVFIILIALLFSGCNSQQSEGLDKSRTEELLSLSQEFIWTLNGGDLEAAFAMMNDTMIEAVEDKLESIWLQLVETQGPLIETGNYLGETSDGYEAIEMTLIFENGTIIQRTVFDSENRITGLRFKPGEIEGSSEDLPSESIEEIAVTVDAGDGYPLDGILTMPKTESPVAAVVLVHGSGPSDMNETIGANAPFKELAHALAEQGIAALRYDKRTYAYGTEIAALPDVDKLTIDEETAYDAVVAVKLLKSWEGIDEDRVYLLGHSMGGGLLSYINTMGADCAGYIIMAGTPRSLWELSAEQNLLYADEIEQAGEIEQAEEIRLAVEQEIQKGFLLYNMSDADALNEANSVFGMGAWYLRKFEQIDVIALHIEDSKPVLILQGEKDRQVTMVDFQLWKDGLAAHNDVTFISYPKLNHLFGEYSGDEVPFSKLVAVEYSQNTPVSDIVINDISEWIINNSR